MRAAATPPGAARGAAGPTPGRSGRRLRGDRGMVSAFVTITTVALVVVAGLVYDGGYLLAAKRQAMNEAESAARAGAQALSIDAVRGGGGPVIDPVAAEARVRTYLAATGHAGDVQVSGDRVTVTVRIQRSPAILSLTGMGPVTVQGTGTARAARGIDGADP